ncbi:Tricorn protease domain-containing protein [Vibrio lentus]|uniref:Tricorn protease domain-containing protein n=2 Tax=Vibrio lentus TaxID=136468 RepID=UPI0007EEAF20|nr:Tricorn protease domain-containing protein [Vibrio lentus]OBT21918.1 Tricorn protease domain-containing protein [Vibrio tasmaniensis]PMG18234.1 Tricorn protease domain-containing protein [Vibrio lentus]PMH14255.1 Tricorn protease domain-containing protein [Vibrio lentus]PMI37363.1 Tricorn protease domain-containing protein [Vibrio lentus]PMI62864.1 Tricorn protease domain-containing protein [Vibrio lentus]
MKLRHSFSTIALLVLSGCNNESVEPTVPEQQQAVKPQTVEDDPVAAKNAQQWDDGRVYITENNYVIYDKETDKPKYTIRKAKEWPREDLSNQDSYDLPRVVFRWDNGRGDSKDLYEIGDKVWSVKTDGTDLRLVADEFGGMVRLIRMSPNNRYLALAYSAEEGMFKVIKDLKTGEYIELGRSRGYAEFLWAEDSSYLYYVDKFGDWKYTLATGVKRQVETEFNEYSVIYQGKRVIASDLGVGVYDESQDERLYSVVPDETSEVAVARFRNKSISPTGRYVWAETRTHRYLIDVKNKSFQSEEIIPRAMGKFRYFEVLGKDANYIHEGAARVVVSKLTEEKHFGPYLKWKQTNSGHSADLSSLYNAFANNGDFVKGEEL